MKHHTEIINNRIVNYVAQLASFLKPGDLFCKPIGRTLYQFDELRANEQLAICKNLETKRREKIYYNSPVFKLLIL